MVVRLVAVSELKPVIRDLQGLQALNAVWGWVDEAPESVRARDAVSLAELCVSAMRPKHRHDVVLGRRDADRLTAILIQVGVESRLIKVLPGPRAGQLFHWWRRRAVVRRRDAAGYACREEVVRLIGIARDDS